MKTQYRISIDIRYNTINEYDDQIYHNPIYTLGITDTKDEAVNIGNKVLDFFDKIYEKNPHCYDRLSNKMDIISDSQYYKVPFKFFITIKPMHFENIDNIMIDILKDISTNR